MRVLAARQPGGPDQLHEQTLPDQPLQPGQARIATAAVGLNYADLVQISGDFQIPAPDPMVPGFELAGTLIEVAPDVTDLQVGQRVMALVAWGAYTDSLVVDAVRVLAVPDDMTDLTAAAFPVAYATAHVSLVHRGGLSAGQTAVITGATGNVGTAALQIARAIGAITIAVDRSGTPAAGADHAIPTSDVAAAVQDLTGGRGADLALDLVGGDLTAELLRSLAWEGRLVSTGFASGAIPTVSLLDVLVGNVAVIGEDIAGYAARDPATIRRALMHCLHWYVAGLLTPRTPTAHPFLDHAASGALTAIADGTAGGKHALSVTP